MQGITEQQKINWKAPRFHPDVIFLERQRSDSVIDMAGEIHGRLIVYGRVTSSTYKSHHHVYCCSCDTFSIMLTTSILRDGADKCHECSGIRKQHPKKYRRRL